MDQILPAFSAHLTKENIKKDLFIPPMDEVNTGFWERHALQRQGPFKQQRSTEIRA